MDCISINQDERPNFCPSHLNVDQSISIGDYIKILKCFWSISSNDWPNKERRKTIEHLIHLNTTNFVNRFFYCVVCCNLGFDW